MLMKRNKWILYIDGALLAVFTACSADAPMEMTQDDRVEIRVNSSIASSVEPATRAVVDGMINSSFGTDLDVAFVRADADDASGNYTDYKTSALAGTVSYSEKKLRFSPAEYYLSNGNKTKLIGWYPRRDGVTFTSDTRVVSFGAIDGKTDIMVTPLKEGNKTTAISDLAFSHLLTQISVKVYAPDEDTQKLWGTVTSIAIAGMKQTCTVTLPEATSTDGTTVGSPTFAGSEDLDLVKVNPTASPSTAITYPLTIGIADDADAVTVTTAGYAMFAPQATGKITLKIALSAGGNQTAQVTVPTGGFKAGTSYAITLKFTSAGVTPTISVTDWVTGDAIKDITI